MYTRIYPVKRPQPQFLVAHSQPMPQSSTLPPDLCTLHGANVRRLMARLNMTQGEVVQATGLDERTVRSMLQGVTRPHARTLHKLADGLGVSTDELFQDPYQTADTGLAPATFDQATNPIAAEVVDAHPELFEHWAAADFNELFSRMAVGGELTETGTLTVVEAMNERRELMYQVAVVMESSEADLMRDFVKLLFRRVTAVE